MIAVSTGGGSPAFARHMRELLEETVDSAQGELLALLAEIRPMVRQRVPRCQQRALWDALLDGRVLECLRTEGAEAAHAMARSAIDSFGRCIGQDSVV